MERCSGTENSESLKSEVIAAWREGSPEAREKYCRWLEAKESEIESERDPAKYRLKQIELNIERGDIFTQAKMANIAQDQYLEAISQLEQEIGIPESTPNKIKRETINLLLGKTKQKLSSL
jgi:hypothetical protein